MAIYVYGYCRSDAAPPDPLETGVGEPPGAVEYVVEQDLAAIVTAVDPQGVPPRRASLLAHAEVLRRALARGPVLPLRFGMVVADTDAVRAELGRRAGELSSALDRFDGRLEMNLSATYLEEELLREILAEQPALARAGRALRDKPAEATHFERIRLGEHVAHAVEAKRERDAAAIVDALRPLAVATSTGEPLHERMVLNAAFLVDDAQLARFDAAVEGVSRDRASRMRFKLLGPLPPHSFVESVTTWA